MRSRNTENTGNTGKGPQINIGRGRVVRELYNQEIHQDDEIVYDSEGNAYKRICEPYLTQDVPPESDDEFGDVDVTDSVTTKVKHEIKLTDDSPVYQRPFRLPQTQRKEVKAAEETFKGK
ncbi:hypothetical protein EVAR_66187_1 [Eumeta japonica]|uniref:Uncharacterized protein n=1 Tax=Eumeta variegata TaxID=151549 RepID=A0A4C1ZPF3_EUMVA|nr:hypothetical protein EVAR_66187_1 [Eumeta japonica]